MDKKRILVYTENYLPSVGGLENNTALLCQTLCDLGHEVTLLTPQKYATKSSDFLVIEAVNISQYFSLIRNKEIILVNGGISFKIIIPCLFLGKNYMVTYQMASLFNHIHTNSLKTHLTNKLRKILAKNAKLNIGVSKYSFKELRSFFGEKKTALLINPANPIFFNQKTLDQNKSSFDCLFSGRLIEGKGIKLLIAAIEKIRSKGFDVNLHIIGQGPEKKWIKTKLNADYLSLHPPTDAEGLKAWYQMADLTIIPSTSHIEGSPLVMAESIAMGTPVLVANQPAMVEALNNEHLYFTSGDLDNLVLKLSNLLNPEIYTEMLNYTQTLAKDYEYKNYIRQLDKIVNA